MDTADKVSQLRIITESDENEEILLSYLSQAADVIINRLDPYNEHALTEVPERFCFKQIRIAAYFMNKRGAEGETQHIENGIHRNYKSSDVPEDMLWDVFPYCGVVR